MILMNFFFVNDDTSSTSSTSSIESIKPESTTTKKPIITKKSSFVSNLSSSIKNFTQSTISNNNKILFDIQPRLTDDKLPKTITTPSSTQNITELKTFKMSSESDSFKSSSIIKPRESRINPEFLRLYSYESSSRQKGLLKEITPQDEENFIYYQNKFLQQPKTSPLNEKEFSMMIRNKLWKCVILPPRDDYIPQNPNYIKTDNNQKEGKSLINTTTDQRKPWVNLDDEKIQQKVIKPYGIMGDVQFTVKGWCNERWLPSE
ncbi:hypothetical protein BN7_5313 [Wickerhamomyces ciferrii]|uniref:Uncharacterized protein n=1 Tax=Wickerhamomyces ciferrii (strain ATCC 14091 / BCRC 22168 / CBS 111 / JCM 3599 / NBRC 0793 / NRRL Y-1031 F-60-10) TaxID=1206466 RepID=K0KUZ2_WICCF|nr:uncharacterized protein BN7_5313 [Wickerhamomyces ciferrii]CCH45727.1 hypothetical protein BN7_5313 [Wickerhamomyces ciferrii]